MDRQDYINKSNNLLNQSTYRAIPWDPTNTIKNKLINILKRVKNQKGLDSVTYKSMYPTGCLPPKFYELPQIHKLETPLRPIVSRLLCPYVLCFIGFLLVILLWLRSSDPLSFLLCFFE